MTATAFQLRRRQAAAESIVAQLGTAALCKQFIKAAPLAIAKKRTPPPAGYASGSIRAHERRMRLDKRVPDQC